MNTENWKRLTKAGLILLAIFMAASIILNLIYELNNFFFINEGIEFYTQSPHLLFLCIIFALALGAIIWITFRIFRNNPRGLIKVCWILGNIFLLIATGVLMYTPIKLIFLFGFRGFFEGGTLLLLLRFLIPAVLSAIVTLSSIIYFIRFCRKPKGLKGLFSSNKSDKNEEN